MFLQVGITLFSSDTGDAWLLDRDHRLALPLARHGDAQPFHIEETDTSFAIDQLFNGLAAHPSAPEYWWLYALLVSSTLSSLIKFMIGGVSFLRGIPGLPSLLLRFMPAGKAVPAFERTWLALVLTLQIFVGAGLGIAAQVVLAVGVIFYLMPWIGLGLLDTTRVVADFDLPGQVAVAAVGRFIAARTMRTSPRLQRPLNIGFWPMPWRSVTPSQTPFPNGLDRAMIAAQS
jgi:hypothetical protein